MVVYFRISKKRKGSMSPASAYNLRFSCVGFCARGAVRLSRGVGLGAAAGTTAPAAPSAAAPAAAGLVGSLRPPFAKCVRSMRTSSQKTNIMRTFSLTRLGKVNVHFLTNDLCAVKLIERSLCVVFQSAALLTPRLEIEKY